MSQNIDKRIRADQFRTRLHRAMQDTATNQTALARKISVDRSTISQLLKDKGARLPNAHVVGSCAAALGVSADWLLGLSDRPENAADLMAASLSLTTAKRALVDEQILSWHQEAEGYKIRHVPTTLPDMLKTTALMEWEYGPHLGRTAQQAINASQDRLDWINTARSDYEIAIPIFEIASFANATGYYVDLPIEIRRAQLDHLIDLTRRLYPRLRLSLFDARKLYCAPITVFGPLLAVFFAGGHYLAFRDRERIEAFMTHFDTLIREATISARDVPEYLERL